MLHLYPDFPVRPRVIRALHLVLDVVFALYLKWGILILVIFFGVEDIFYDIPERLFGFLCWVTYYLIFEFGFGRPLSHYLTNSRIVMLSGGRPTRLALLKRVLLRMIPIDWLTFLENSIRGIHDAGSGTLVVSRKVARELQEKAGRS